MIHKKGKAGALHPKDTLGYAPLVLSFSFCLSRARREDNYGNFRRSTRSRILQPVAGGVLRDGRIGER